MSTSRTAADWLVCRQLRPRADMRLFCLPFAGGGPSAFNEWWREMPRSVELHVGQLPGREARFRETPVPDFHVLVQRLTDAFESRLDRPYAVFGYSMGALLGFEVIRRLRCRGAPAPMQLMVAARGGPRRPSRTPHLAHLPRQEFIDGVSRYYEPPGDAWGVEELVEVILPSLRADMVACEAYRYRREELLSCPIVAFCGDRDRSEPYEDVVAWGEETTGPFEVDSFPGGHFFINDHAAEIRRRVVASLHRGPSA